MGSYESELTIGTCQPRRDLAERAAGEKIGDGDEFKRNAMLDDGKRGACG